jgi:Kef-type K+ transport system membrane component KefB
MNNLQFLPPFPFPESPLVLFGALLLAGALCGELVRRVLNLPRVTGYLLSGLVLGGSGLDVLDADMRGYARSFLDIGLAMILFELGARLDLDWLRRDRWLAAMAGAECVLSFACMFGALYWTGVPPLYAAAAGAIGVSSSPAVALLVVRELKAEGQVTERTLNLVAINSVVALLLMTMMLSAIHREYQAGMRTMILHPFYLLAGSLLLGFFASVVTLLLGRWLGKRRDQHLALLLAMIAILVGASSLLKLPSPLVMLTFGVLLRNLDQEHALMPIETGRFGQVFYVVLFVVTGAAFDLASLVASSAISAIYVAARFVGKSIGVLGLAHFSGIRPGSGGLLSIALTPMSGGALAMALSNANPYPEFGQRLAAIVLGASLILELAGPAAVQFALRRAGETQKEGP